MKNFYQVGDNLPVLESLCVHPTHTSGLVQSGDQVIAGDLCGVSNEDAASSSDTVVLSTRGVYTLPVHGHNSGGNSAVAFGDAIYCDPGSNADLSKDSSKKPFGIALGTVSSGATTTIPVKLTPCVTTSVVG